jgi:glycosyltransferase involved in cell wall biosynthesis
MKKRIAIITNFFNADEAYSLNRVVTNQIKMLVKNDYPVTVVAVEGFKNHIKDTPYEHPLVTIAELPSVPVYNDLRIDDSFEDDINKLKEAFKKALKGINVSLTHDIVYQPAGLKHNIALRQLFQNKKDMLFLHWVHSATEPAILSLLRNGGNRYLEILKSTFPNSYYITFNTYSTERIAGWFGIEVDRVKYVPHPHDFCEYKDERTKAVVDKYDLLSKDIIMMYPCRLDRGKQPEMAIKIAHQVKKTNRSVACIIADFHSTGGDKVVFRNEMKEMGVAFGLDDDELIFLSEFEMPNITDNEITAPVLTPFKYEVPHKIIQELFDFTNAFVMPSKSETYSLVTQEAIMKRNFVILNQDFPPFRSIFGDGPYYRQFSSNINVNTGLDGETNTTYNNEQEYFYGIASYINYVQEHSRILSTWNNMRKTRNLDYVFKHNIEPLLYAGDNKFNY